MRIIKEAKVIDDDWSLVNAESTVPDSGPVIIPLSTYREDPRRWAARKDAVGVLLASSESPDSIENLDALPLIAIDFPKFADGRGYSHARLLRDKLGYEGEIRAVGEVLQDQLFYMKRCGIDSFALKMGKDIDGAVSSLKDFSVTYQAAADTPQALFNRVKR